MDPRPRSDPPRRRVALNVETLAISAARTGEGNLTISLRYAYEGRPPGLKKRVALAKTLLQETLDRLEGTEPADLGFHEDSLRRARTDKMEA